MRKSEVSEYCGEVLFWLLAAMTSGLFMEAGLKVAVVFYLIGVAMSTYFGCRLTVAVTAALRRHEEES